MVARLFHGGFWFVWVFCFVKFSLSYFGSSLFLLL